MSNLSTTTSPTSLHRPLAGRVAVVTGASSGIGEATAALLAARGAKVALLARRKARLDTLAARIQAAGGTALALAVDVTDQRSLDAAAAHVVERLGRPSLVVNNAGVMLPAPITERRTDDWQRMIDLNLTGAVRVIGAFTPALLDAAAAGGAADLVNVSSIGAQQAFPTFAVYCATKAAITHLSRNLRTELGPKDVRVSVIEPGIVVTELPDHVTDRAAKDWIMNARSSYDVLQPEDVAEAVVYLASQPRHVNVQQLTLMPTRQV